MDNKDLDRLKKLKITVIEDDGSKIDYRIGDLYGDITNCVRKSRKKGFNRNFTIQEELISDVIEHVSGTLIRRKFLEKSDGNHHRQLFWYIHKELIKAFQKCAAKYKDEYGKVIVQSVLGVDVEVKLLESDSDFMSRQQPNLLTNSEDSLKNESSKVEGDDIDNDNVDYYEALSLRDVVARTLEDDLIEKEEKGRKVEVIPDAEQVVNILVDKVMACYKAQRDSYKNDVDKILFESVFWFFPSEEMEKLKVKKLAEKVGNLDSNPTQLIGRAFKAMEKSLRAQGIDFVPINLKEIKDSGSKIMKIKEYVRGKKNEA